MSEQLVETIRNQIEKKRKPRQNAAKQNQIPNFLLKTYKILENEDYKDIITWNEDGTSFKIIKTSEFSEKILPNFFKSNKFESFVRQLNMYDFRKLSRHHDSDANEWKHPNFQRGKPDLLGEIKRKIADQSSIRNFDESSMMQLIQSKEKDKEFQMIYKEMDKLYHKQDVLEKACHILIAQNNQILSENKILWQEMVKNNRDRERHDRKLEKIFSFFLSYVGGGNKFNFNLRNYDGQDIDVESLQPYTEKAMNKKKAVQLQKMAPNQNNKEGEKILKKLLKGMNPANIKANSSTFENFIDNYHQNHSDLIKNLQMYMDDSNNQGNKRHRKSFDLLTAPEFNDNEINPDMLDHEAFIKNLEKQNFEKNLNQNKGGQFPFSPQKQDKNMPLMITEKSNSNQNNFLLQDFKKSQSQVDGANSSIEQLVQKNSKLTNENANLKQSWKMMEKQNQKKNQQLSEFQEHLSQKMKNMDNMDNYKMETFSPKNEQQQQDKLLNKVQQSQDFKQFVEQMSDYDFNDSSPGLDKVQFSLSNRPSSTNNNNNGVGSSNINGNANASGDFVLNQNFNNNDYTGMFLHNNPSENDQSMENFGNFLQLSRNPSVIQKKDSMDDEDFGKDSVQLFNISDHNNNNNNNNNGSHNNKTITTKKEEKTQNKQKQAKIEEELNKSLHDLKFEQEIEQEECKKDNNNNSHQNSNNNNQNNSRSNNNRKNENQIQIYQQQNPILPILSNSQQSSGQLQKNEPLQQSHQQQLQQQGKGNSGFDQNFASKMEEDNMSVNKYLNTFGSEDKMMNSLENSFF